MKTDRGDQLLDDLVETLCVRGNGRTTADVQGELAQRENIPSAIPARKTENVEKHILLASDWNQRLVDGLDHDGLD